MTKQLTLVPTPSWRFDAETRTIGLQGVASAREALAAAKHNIALANASQEHTVTEAA